jgi:hypothetical protein
MKNKLLLTSALVGSLAITGIATAEVKIGVNHEQTFAASSVDDNQGSGSALGSETNFSASGKNELDNGFAVGFNFNWEMDGSASREYQLSIGNDTAALVFGNDLTQGINSTAVPKVGEHPGTISGRGIATQYQDSYNAAENNQDEHIAIELKGIAGGKIVAIYAPDAGSDQDDADIASGRTTGAGETFTYVGKPVENLTVVLGQAKKRGANASSVDTNKEDKEKVYGIGYNFGQFAVGIEKRDLDDGAGAKDIKGMYYGATANLSDQFSIGIGYTVSEDDTTTSNPDEKQTVVTAGYNFGGLGIELSYADVENAKNSTANTADGEVMQLRTKVSF